MAECKKFEAEMQQIIEKAQGKLQAEITQLSQEAEREAQDIQDDAPSSNDPEVALGFDVDVEMVEQRVKLHVPKITISKKKISLHLPEVTMKDKKLSFNVPVTEMVRRRVGSRPVTKCETRHKRVRGIRIPYPHCETTFEPIYMDIPEVRVDKRSISFGYPVIAMKLSEFSLGYPEFSMELKEIVFHTPSITIRNVRAEIRESQDRADKLEREMEADTTTAVGQFRHDVANEIKVPHTKLFGCYRDEILAQREATSRAFEAPMTMLSTAIRDLKNNETDEDRDEIASLEAERTKLVAQAKAAEKSFGDALKDLTAQQEASLQSILDGLAPAA